MIFKKRQRVSRIPANFSFWNNKTRKMEIINEEDFPVNDILNRLDINTSLLKLGFGNCDGEEARERVAVMKFIHKYPDFVILMRKVQGSKNIPTNNIDFQTYYDPKKQHNPFWKNVHNLNNFLNLKKNELPNRVKNFHDIIIDHLELEAKEKDVVKIISEQLEGVAVLEGLAEIRVTGKEVNRVDFFEFHGHRTFSYALSEARQRDFKKYYGAKKFFFGWWAALSNVFTCIYNDVQRKKAYKPMVIKKTDEVQQDLRNGFEAVFDEIRKKTEETRTYIKYEPVKEESEESIERRKFFEDNPTQIYKIYFSYGKNNDGINMIIYDITVPSNGVSRTINLDFKFDEFKGYSIKRQGIIREAQKEIKMTALKQANDVNQQTKRLKLHDIFSDVLNKSIFIKSKYTDHKHKWQSLNNLYALKEIAVVYDDLIDLRLFIGRCSDTLLAMKNVIGSVEKVAKENKTSFCFPEILPDDDDIIEFSDLYPLHLEDGDKIVPVNGFSEINGNMIGITGRHGGGKTVTEHAITDNVYIALSGIPVLGKKFRLNPKTHMGMVFIEGVKGQSVCQLLVNKMEKVFRGIDKVTGNKILIVLDELGSATQERDGLELSLQVLNKLHEKRVSLLFSTQITDLAIEAESRFNAKCFKVNKKHKLLPGIGGGELQSIVKSSGLAKYL